MTGHTTFLQDTETFNEFYSKSHLIIFRFIYGLHGGPHQDVEDLTAETFIRAWKGRRRFQGDEKAALGWLFTIARHLVIDAHRRGKAYQRDTGISSDEISLEAWQVIQENTQEENDPEKLIINYEQFKFLWALIHALPTEKRELVVLRYILGFQVKHIAEMLKIPENTISVYLRRIREDLSKKWPSG